ncbi:membrane protein [Adhaeribacter aerolatus]|uniref:Membrane protein n=1 Tax=Adhaeribacter aerolatus TaxID=670289 RepID=A0A512AUI6_9BACT|nr:RagB/SusD family nutrient uptake outer membrane protein [Adhaeribacter aerolatus]GEO03378.1 membrane protein [Adhaeribacter aerolatus]
MKATINLNNNLVKKILLLLLVTGLISCEKFLEVEPKDQVTADAIYESTGTADLFLNNIYAGIPGPFNTFDPTENFTDNAMNGVNGQVSRVLYANSVYTASNAPSLWNLYNNIRAANLFIQKVTASSLDESWKKQRLGEARFLRAYYYQLLWTRYGGVPIITDVLSQDQGEEMFRPRNTDAETFKFITDECAAIAADLPIKAEAGRATRGAALTLKGWCELFNASPLKNPANDKSKWALAAATNKQVMDLKAYDLFPDYGTQFLEDNNDNIETIFAKKYLGGTSLGSSREGLQGTWIVGGVQRAYGGVDPTQELVDEYAMSNGLPITDPASGYDPQNPYVNREKRFYQSIVYDGATWAGAEIVIRHGVGSRNETDLSNLNEATNTGYYLLKGLNPKFAINGNHLQSSANFIIFRYAEVLLSYAEAQNEAVGPDPSVYAAVNEVRERSELPPLKEGLSQEQMRVAIHRERRVELAFEEKRLSDLMRLKLAEKNLNGTLHAMLIEMQNGKLVYKVIPAAEGARTFYANKNYLFPIPQAALDRNKNLTQNPNY